MSDEATTQASDPPSNRGLRKLGAPVVAVFAFLLAVGAYYLFYEKKNEDYLIHRDHRLLATMSRQVGAAVDGEGKVLKTLYDLRDSERKLLGQHRPQRILAADSLRQALHRVREEYGLTLGGAADCKDRVDPEGRREGAYQEPILRGRDTTPEGYRLSFRYRSLCGWVYLKELLEPIFVSHQAAFEAVLLADEHGEVINQPPEMSIQSLGLLLDPAGSLQAKGNDKAESASFQTVLHTLMGSSRDRELEVEIHGRKFKLFVQPVRLVPEAAPGKSSRPKEEKVPAEQERHRDWLLCGLVPSASITSASLAVPPSYLAAAVAVLLLCLLSWPLLKLKLLGERQRVRMADLLMVALCSVLGVCLLTLILLDFDHHRGLESQADSQLQGFASRMAYNLEQEIRRAYAQLEVLEQAAAERGTRDQDLPGLLQAKGLQGSFDCYPFLDSFALIDGNGQQQLKWSVDDVTFPLISVDGRDYFKRTVREDEDPWFLPPWNPSTGEDRRCAKAAPDHHGERYGPFMIESVVSLVSGVRQAVLAKPASEALKARFGAAGSARAGLEDRFVSTLTMPMLSVIGPVVPPAFEFAVIDKDGNVQFHSDGARNLAENLFAETDQDRHLRSAVFARHRATLDVRYWGNDYKASVVPVRGPQWTIVGLRAKDPIEAANLQTVLTSMVFILLYAGALALFLATVALVRPAYRAEWLWPAPERSNDYLRLGLLYLLLCLAFVSTVFVLPENDRLVGVACLLALLAAVLGYLQLTGHRRREAMKIAWASPLALLCLLLAALLAPAETGSSPAPGQSADWISAWLPLGLTLPPVLAASFLVCFYPKWWRRLTRHRQVSVSWAYPALGVLLLVLTAALPTLCIFKLAQRIQTDCLLKLGQLKLAMDVNEHHARAAKINSWRDGKEPLPPSTLAFDIKGLPGQVLRDNGQVGTLLYNSLDFYGQFFFQTQLTGPDPDEGKAGESLGIKEVMPDFLQALLPMYSAYAAETRELLHDMADDKSWHWDRDGEALALESEDLGFRVFSWPQRTWLSAGHSSPPPKDAPPRANLNLPAREGGTGSAGAVPGGGDLTSVWAAAAGAVGRGATAAAGPAGRGATAAAFLLLLAGLAYFISRRVFLVDLFEPLWSGREGLLPATVGGNVFLVSRHRQWHVRDHEQSFFRLHFKDFEAEPPGWPDQRLEHLHSLPVRNFLVEGFEHRIFEPAINDRKLALLEDLTEDRTVIVLSTVSPAVLFAGQEAGAAGTPAASPGSQERWRSLFGSFVVFDEDLRRADQANLANISVRAWRELKELLRRGRRACAAVAAGYTFKSALLAEECGGNPFLLQIGSELDPLAFGLKPRQLLEEFGERAELYYRSLWASCSRDEKVVLGHLAEDGLINEKDRRVVRRLMARGLIRREPVFQLMNETFRCFVLSPGCRREVLEHEQATGASPWDRFRLPFFAVLAAGAVFFLATQKQLVDGSMAIATAVAAGLPAVTKVLDLLGGRRAGGAPK
jgi:hypothetical protein